MSELDLYDFPPRKQTITYGKTAKRRTLAATNEKTKNGDSTAERSGTSRASTSHSGSPEPRPRSRPVAPTSKTRLTVGNIGSIDRGATRVTQAARPKIPKEAQSQPSLTTASMEISLRDDEDAALKKRKLTRTYSERKTEPDLYDIPDSPPRTTRPTTKKVQSKTLSEGGAVTKGTRVPKPAQRPFQEQAPKPSQTPEREVVMRDVAPQQTGPFSAKTSRALENLRVGMDSPPRVRQDMPIRLSQQSSAPSQLLGRKRPSAPPNSSESRRAVSAGPRKRRLIDKLAEQAEVSEEENSQQSASSIEIKPKEKLEPVELTFRDASPDAPSGSQVSQSTSRSAARSATGTKKGGPRFTYSQQRSMLAEDDPLFSGFGLGSIEEDVGNGSMFDFGRLPKPSAANKFAFLDEDEETSNTGAVKSLHELRQAGANSRFADEMDDIMDRIGSPSAKPSSLRRGALLELAQKIGNRAFRRQFRDHSDCTKLFSSLGDEVDLISGYSIVAVLVTLLAASSSTHLVQQLLGQNVIELLCRLLGEAVDIAVLVKDRKQNASKHIQAMVTTIKTSLLASPIWEPCAPTFLSPRTIALKCFDLIRLQPTPSPIEENLFTKQVTDRLFSVISADSFGDLSWDFPANVASTDLYLTLYLLEHHSVHAMQSSLGPVWTREYVPTVVDVLEMVLRRPVAQFHELENLVLRLAVNITNNNFDASRMFVEQDLLRALAKSTCDAFEIILNAIAENEAFLAQVHESLVVMLAVMINLCAYYPPAAQSLEAGQSEAGLALVRLIHIFAENHTTTSDANSMEKFGLNVALGYLSIVLGYLCLSTPVRRTFVQSHPKKSIQPLLASISEFISVHNQVAEVQDTQSSAMARLQRLVDQLSG